MRFTTLAALANELRGRRANELPSHRPLRPHRAVVFDELGYLALPDGAAELVFQVLSERHERAA